MMRRIPVFVVLLAGGLAPGGAADLWKAARPDYGWSFPQDSWAHPGYRNEWWYFTGQLTPVGETTPRFGYQFTLFRVGLVPQRPAGGSRWHTADLLMGHAAVTDLASGRHVFSEVLYRAMPELARFGVFPDPRIAWSRGPVGGGGEWSLSWNGDGFDFAMADGVQRIAFELSTAGAGRPLLQGPNGFSRKAAEPTAASHYYSHPELQTSGWVETEGRRVEVAGRTWMDHEFSSNVLTDEQVGWDWLSLRRPDGEVWMLFQLRDRDGARSYGSATRRTAGGEVRYLAADEFELKPLDIWVSPTTAAPYPVRWRVAAAGAAFVVEAVVRAQENHSRLVPGLSYWEGAVRALDLQGRELGRGYLEMTGYGEGTRPPL